MKSTAIIFGSSGQDGFYLNRLLKKEQVEVINISRTSGDYMGTVGDFNFVENIIKLTFPKYVFHLAANSSTKHDVTIENNNSISTGTINILESIKRHTLNTKVFISGSALQFKNDGFPIDESSAFDYLSSYAISRNHSVQISRYYREKFGIKVFVGYFFNHDSPLRSENHINQKIITHVIKILNGSQDKLIIGNLNVKKEFNFAEDIVEAAWILLNQDKFYEAVIGSGMAYSIREWVKYCFDKYSLNWENYIIQDTSYKSEYDILVSNPKIIKELGWKPRSNIFELADLMLESEFKKSFPNNL